MAHRYEVLKLYRTIFRVARGWQAISRTDTINERQYIKTEARKLFHKNKEVVLNNIRCNHDYCFNYSSKMKKKSNYA